MAKHRAVMFLGMFVVAVLALAAALPRPEGSGYHLMKKYQVGGEGFWDYLKMDSEARRLYIS
ncbi:MAG: hypothetical protein DMG21_06065, partial [Acidobacteria bacterium]